MDIKFAKDKSELEWGEITKEDILRRIHKSKSLEEMSQQEIEKMLDDLI